MTWTHKNFFPYEVYRPEQRDLMRYIELNARLGKNVLLLAPNGTGKTVIALCALLSIAKEKGLKIIYVCRTHTQSTRVIEELQNIVHHSYFNISGLALRGRKQLCLHPTLSKLNLDSIKAMEYCQELRTYGYCRYFINLVKHRDSNSDFDHLLFKQHFNRPVDGEQIFTYCKEKEICPYFTSKSLLKFEEVVVCNFHWMLDPEIRSIFLSNLGVFSKKYLLVIDESHNIIDMATKINSEKLTLSLVLSLLLGKKPQFDENLIKTYTRFLSFLVIHLKNMRKRLKVGDTQLERNALLKLLFKKIDLESFKKFLKDFKKLLRDLYFNDRWEIILSKIHQFINFWRRYFFF